jgi:glycine/D-amino acid oxidase-like deaminating enzyme
MLPRVAWRASVFAVKFCGYLMMRVDVLIVGQGICGTLLSWFLKKEGKSFLVIDDARENSSSRLAAGIINPVTGRRYVTTWMYEELLSFAKLTYEEMGAALDSQFIFEKNIIDFFPSPQMRDAFVNRITEDDTYLHSYPDQNKFNQFFNYEFGCGQVKPVYLVNLQLLMASWKKELLEPGLIREEPFDAGDLKFEAGGVHYQDISAGRIIFCDGVSSNTLPWFQLLPFAPNKGEALIIRSEEMDDQHIFKQSMVIAPLPVKHNFWVGSSYQWEFENDQPSERFLEQTKKHLDRWLKVPYEILFHKASLRPATLERRPFVGMHPHLPEVGILNGMGTKGSSLAPFFAKQLVDNIVHGFPILPEADIKRFSKILSK